MLRVSTTKIVSRPIDPVEEVSPETTFIAIDTYLEISRKDEFILGNLFDYNGNKINYIWDTKKNQIASLKGKNLNTEIILSSSEFLENIYRESDLSLDAKEISDQVFELIKTLAVSETPKKSLREYNMQAQAKEYMLNAQEREESDPNFVYGYESDDTEPIFAGEFLGDDEEVDDFDEQLALKSQEFLKEHPELKSEMEIVRLLEGN